MLTVCEMQCVGCQREDKTKVVAVLGKGKSPRVYFQVHCSRCGGFSHNLDYPEISKAAKKLIDSLLSKGRTNQ